MRILGEINDLPFKVTALSMNNRLSIKCENGSNELTYKFRDGSIIKTLSDVDSFVRNGDTVARITETFHSMDKLKSDVITNMIGDSELQFPDII